MLQNETGRQVYNSLTETDDEDNDSEDDNDDNNFEAEEQRFVYVQE